MSLNHPDVSDRLFSYLDGCLDEDLWWQVQAHLESCGSCSDELAAMRAVTCALRQAGRDDLAATAGVERYGCPGAEELTLHEALQADHPTTEGEWITRHLEACLRCQHEVDLIHLMRLALSEPSAAVAPQELSVGVEERLMARVRQGTGADRQTARLGRFPLLSPSFLWRAALGVGFAGAVWGIIQLQQGPVLVAKRSVEQGVRGFQPSLSSPGTRERPPHGPGEPKTGVARVESPIVSPIPMQPSLPPLVPAKQGEALKVLILPTLTRPGLRSAVAAGLVDQLETVQPPDQEFPSEPSIDDLTANRRLGRLFGVRYILEIDVKEQPSGYLIVLRAADTETGGVVAKREGSPSEKEALTAVASRLARELQRELRARP